MLIAAVWGAALAGSRWEHGRRLWQWSLAALLTVCVILAAADSERQADRIDALHALGALILIVGVAAFAGDWSRRHPSQVAVSALPAVVGEANAPAVRVVDEQRTLSFLYVVAVVAMIAVRHTVHPHPWRWGSLAVLLAAAAGLGWSARRALTKTVAALPIRQLDQTLWGVRMGAWWLRQSVVVLALAESGIALVMRDDAYATLDMINLALAAASFSTWRWCRAWEEEHDAQLVRAVRPRGLSFPKFSSTSGIVRVDHP